MLMSNNSIRVRILTTEATASVSGRELPVAMVAMVYRKYKIPSHHMDPNSSIAIPGLDLLWDMFPW